MKFCFGIMCAVLLSCGSARAQHPVDVVKLSSDQQYMEALVAFDKLPQRRVTSEAVLAAARSAWALSLPKRADELYDLALKDERLPTTEQARAILSKGIIQYQEENYQTAIVYADRAVKLLKAPSPLRSKVYALWGESLLRLGQYPQAEDKLDLAVDEAEDGTAADIHYLLAQAQQYLGKLEEAQRHYEFIPAQHEKAGTAIRELARIAMQRGNYDHAEFWLTRGRADFPDEFLDSWVDYALGESLLRQGKKEDLVRILDAAEKRYPPSDPWITLLKAAAESGFWLRVPEEKTGKEA